MNAYKRYCKRREKFKLAQTFLMAEMARFQIQAVMSQPIGFKATEDEMHRAKIEKAIVATRIAINAVQQISKIYSKPQ